MPTCAHAPDVPSATPLRTSSYTIYVDLKDDRENVLLVHGYSSAFDVVSRHVAAYLRSRDAKSPPKPLYGEWSVDRVSADDAVIPSDATLALLKRRGYLTAMTVEEELAFFLNHVRKLNDAAQSQMPVYVIMPTYDCNLRCGYCFQDHMRTNPAFSHLLRVLTPSMADRIISALPQFELRHHITPEAVANRRFLFFGGEPLLAESLPIIEYFMDKARAAGPASFAAVSNGTQLHRFEHLLGPGKIEELQITLDGPPARHDTRRIHADGSGSFEAIARNISLALERGVRVEIRMNVDRANIADIPELAEIFTERGWTAYPTFSSTAEPVTDTNFGTPGRRSQLFNSFELNEEVARLRQSFAAMAAVGTHDDPLALRALQIFGRSGAQSMPMQATFCGAHRGMYILDPFGDIYACWEQTGNKNIRIGWIDASGDVAFVDDRLQNWRERSVASNSTCRRCRFALYCGGGCAVLAEAANGTTMHANYCDAFGKRFRTKIAEAYAVHSAAPSAECAVADQAVEFCTC